MVNSYLPYHTINFRAWWVDMGSTLPRVTYFIMSSHVSDERSGKDSQHSRVVHVATAGTPLGAVAVAVITNVNNNGQIGIGVSNFRTGNSNVIIVIGPLRCRNDQHDEIQFQHCKPMRAFSARERLSFWSLSGQTTLFYGGRELERRCQVAYYSSCTSLLLTSLHRGPQHWEETSLSWCHPKCRVISSADVDAVENCSKDKTDVDAAAMEIARSTARA
jgi:hypothetical protein